MIKRRGLFALFGAAAVAPAAFARAPIPAPTPAAVNESAVVMLSEWHDLVRCTGFNLYAADGYRAMQKATVAALDRAINHDIAKELT